MELIFYFINFSQYKKMTLKNSASEMSKKAKAFSVESLLSVKNTEDGILENNLNKNLKLKNGITVELCCGDLWEKFRRLGTEMIVTRAGRRMFPTLKIRLYGLAFTATYVVYMDITLAADTRFRYNFQKSEWTVSGPNNNHMSNSIYIHPDSPAKGEFWMSQENISFDKVKLTNNGRPFMKDQVSLHSMHKYQPRVHILEIPTSLDSENLLNYVREHQERSVTFVFEQTIFITVTAYQNQEITKLKIQSNPFAKGFRDIFYAKRKKLEQESYLGLAYPPHQSLQTPRYERPEYF